MTYAEKDFQTDFGRWLKVIYRNTGAFELKLSKTGTLPFSAVKPHQRDALFHAKRNVMAYKIPDDTYSQKPFDCFSFAGVPAFVVIMFRGKQKHFYLIDIDRWIREQNTSGRKSITEERAAEIGYRYDLGGQLPLNKAVFNDMSYAQHDIIGSPAAV